MRIMKVKLDNTNGFEQSSTMGRRNRVKTNSYFLLKCPSTGEEIPFRWKGIKEKNEIRTIYQEIVKEYKFRKVS